jgi:hypothetical protein
MEIGRKYKFKDSLHFESIRGYEFIFLGFTGRHNDTCVANLIVGGLPSPVCKHFNKTSWDLLVEPDYVAPIQGESKLIFRFIR